MHAERILQRKNQIIITNAGPILRQLVRGVSEADLGADSLLSPAYSGEIVRFYVMMH